MAIILLISDDGPAVELVRSALVIAGHEVLVTKDPALVRRRCDLAIVDLAWSHSAGSAREVAGRVVLLSSATESVTRQRVAQSGADGYLCSKGPGQLLEDVRHLLDAA
jgi:DNA-binding response OmpR family regulator